MTLLELLVNKLPERGGWPKSALCITQDSNGSICVWGDVGVFFRGHWQHPSGKSLLKYWAREGFGLMEDFATSIITSEQYENALAGSKTEWNGEGMPPVGCECEFNACDRGWEKCTVMYASKYTVILHTISDGDPEEAFIPEDLKFRPIRSEVDKKRDEYVQAMIDFEKRVFGSLETHHKAVYDAIAAGQIPHVRIV